MDWLTRWVRPTALLGITTGLRYAGSIQQGGRQYRVYSNLEVVSSDTTSIMFEGGAGFAHNDGGSVRSGQLSGKVVATFRDRLFGERRPRTHFFSMAF